MAGRKKTKNWTAMTFKLENGIASRLSEYHEETGIPMTLAVERALAIYLDEYDKTGRVALPDREGDAGGAHIQETVP